LRLLDAPDFDIPEIHEFASPDVQHTLDLDLLAHLESRHFDQKKFVRDHILLLYQLVCLPVVADVDDDSFGAGGSWVNKNVAHETAFLSKFELEGGFSGSEDEGVVHENVVHHVGGLHLPFPPLVHVLLAEVDVQLLALLHEQVDLLEPLLQLLRLRQLLVLLAP